MLYSYNSWRQKDLTDDRTKLSSMHTCNKRDTDPNCIPAPLSLLKVPHFSIWVRATVYAAGNGQCLEIARSRMQLFGNVRYMYDTCVSTAAGFGFRITK